MNKRQVIAPLVYAAVLVCGLLAGYFFQHKDRSVVGNGGFSKVDEVMSHINSAYVDTVDLKALEEDAIVEMLSQLDPHSQYISVEEYNEVNDPLEGSFEGIGITFRIERDTIMVISTIKGGPSEKVGVLAGDRIVYVDDSLVAGVGVKNNNVVKMLKGPRNTKVSIQVKRRGIDDLIAFDILRDVVPTTSIEAAYMIDDEVGFIKLGRFSATSYNEFVRAMNKLRAQGMRKLIFDLRGNTGGYLNVAVSIVDELLPKGSLIVYTNGRSHRPTYLFAKRHGMWENEDVAVLIDGGSASASEIVAGALQDNDRGIIIGRRSFGKGFVQEPIMLRDGSSIRLTVARYYTPTGRCIQKPFNGNVEDYLLEEYERFSTGEMFSVDSVHFNDSLKYVTPKGKIVYGGGGIMPDVYVPLTNDSSEYYFNKMVNAGIVLQSAFGYSDKHRAEIEKYGDAMRLKKEFTMPDSEFDNMVRQAEAKGIRGTTADKKTARYKTEVLFKAYVSSNIFGDENFYPVYQDIDETIRVAVETIKNQ